MWKPGDKVILKWDDAHENQSIIGKLAVVVSRSKSGFPHRIDIAVDGKTYSVRGDDLTSGSKLLDMYVKVAQRFLQGALHDRSLALMRFLGHVAVRHGVGEHVYVVGGAVRNFILKQPIKDVDVVIDTVRAKRDSAWFAKQVIKAIPVAASYVTNNYGVAIITINGDWDLDGQNMRGEVIEIANARKESYGGGEGKGYKPHMVEPTIIEEDVYRREFTFNSLLWRMMDLVHGPEKAEIIDLTGCGRQDLEEGVLRCPRDPDVVFSDDPTRLLRLVKFVSRYNFKVPSDVVASVRRNAPKIHQAPHEAIAKLFVKDILDGPQPRKAIALMKSLGLLDEVAEMARREKPFAAYLVSTLQGRDPQVLLDLLDLGLESSSPVAFLSSQQRTRLQEVTAMMPRDKAVDFLEQLRRPVIDNMALIEQFQIPPKQRGRLAVLAREAILESPDLAWDSSGLTYEVRRSW